VAKGYWINQSDVTDEAGHAVYAKAVAEYLGRRGATTLVFSQLGGRREVVDAVGLLVGPEGVHLEHDLRREQADEELVGRAAVELVRELPLVVVVSEQQAVPGGLTCERVDALGRGRHVVGALPALGRDEGIDHELDAELIGGVEDRCRIVRIDHRRVPGGRGEAGGGEGPTVVGCAQVERVGLDLRQPELGDASHRAIEVGVDGIAHRIQLD